MQGTHVEYKSNNKTHQVLAYYADIRIQNNVRTPPRQHVSVVSWHLRRLIMRSLRRAIDCVAASVLLIVALPIMIVTAIAIRLDSHGPIIFTQTRVGKQGKAFSLYKFRSMTVDAERRKEELLARNEAAGPVFKIRQDPRITRVGYVIRKLSIDELPQFINVLKGDMNLVGPRPPVPDEVVNYKLEHLRRLEVNPGITGLPQVMGRSNLDFETWVKLDRQYIANQSLRQDLMILLKTVPAVLFGRGAF